MAEMQGNFNGSWFPCQVIHREEDLPNHHRNLWRQKEDKCKEFGDKSYEVVLWLEDDPLAYSVLPSANIKRSSNQSKAETENPVDIQRDLTVMNKGTMTACISSKIEAVPAEHFRGNQLTCVDFSKASNLKTIGENAFNSCNSLQDVVFPKNLEIVGKHAFSGCTKLVLLIMNEGLTTIETGAFHECYSIENLCVPSTVEEIGGKAFSGCEGLLRAALNGTVKIGYCAFRKCPKLKTIGVSPDATVAKSGLPKSAKRFSPEEVFAVVFPLVKKQAEEMGIELPSHAPRCARRSASKHLAVVPGAEDFKIEVMKVLHAEFGPWKPSAIGVEDLQAEVREQQRQVAELAEDKNQLAGELEETKQTLDETREDLEKSQRSLEEAKEYIDRMKKDREAKRKDYEEMKAERNGLIHQIEGQLQIIACQKRCRTSLASELYRVAKDFSTGQRQLEAWRRENSILEKRNKLVTKKLERECEIWAKEKRTIRGHNLQTMNDLEETKQSLEETKSALEAAKAASRETKTVLVHAQARLQEVESERDQLQSKLKSTAESQECAAEEVAAPSQGLLAQFLAKRKADTIDPSQLQPRKCTRTDKQKVREL